MKLPVEKLTLINVKVSRKMLEEFRLEMRRTGLTRSGLIKLAWAEYLERRK